MAILVELKGLAEVIDAAAKAIGTFADSIAKAAGLTLKGYDEVAARRDSKRLRDLYVHLAEYTMGQGLGWSKLNGYVASARSAVERGGGTVAAEDAARLASLWGELLERVASLLGKVEEILAKWRAERSDVVLEEEYATILSALGQREGLFRELMELPPPLEPDEIAAADEVARRWLKLFNELRRANRELAGYLKGE
jgi:hypothetical protein